MSFWVAGASVVGAVGGAYLNSQGNKKASGKAAQGSQNALDEYARQFDTIQGNTANARAMGDQALNALGSIYGYKPASSYYGPASPTAGANLYEAPPMQDTGFFNDGKGKALNPWNVTSKLGGAGKILDPAGGLLGNLFGGHGDEKRNLKAFTEQNKIYDLGNGQLALEDGTTFTQGQLKDIAGTWYGATYAPDGNQADWQQRYSTLIGGLPKAPGAASGGSAQPSAGAAAPNDAAPDYSAFYKSPDYTFRRDEGTRGIERTAAARGGAFSGNALKALNEFNSNLAAGGFNDYFNHNALIAGIGQTATAQTNQAGLYTGAQSGNALQNQGDSRASGVAGQYNAYGNALSDLSQAAGYFSKNRNAGEAWNPDPSGIGYFKPTARRV